MTIKETIFTFDLPSQKIGKRIFDILFSSCILIFGSPLFLLIGLVVKISSKGPIFYKGLRMGQKGKLIYCWKFRTMCLGAEKELEKILEKDSLLKKQWNEYHKLIKDPRLTKIGKFLRMTSLDELPQFWNVLMGDLSVVGPRPIEVQSPQFAEREIRARYHNRMEKILSVKPGITCIWQIKGRNRLTFEKRAELEEEYVDTQSFWLDVQIILKTICLLFIPKGAY